jgi:methionine-rich copper-binding protein CopC
VSGFVRGDRFIRGARRVLAGAALAAMAGIVWVPAAAGHDVLLRTDPAAGAQLAEPPARIQLTFDQQALSIGTAVQVTGPAGLVIAAPPVQVAGSVVTQPLPGGLPAGHYTVVWRAVSADGHPVSGRLAFAATGAASAAAGTAPAPYAAPSTAPAASPVVSSGLASAGPSAGPAQPSGPASVSAPVSLPLLAGILLAVVAVAGAAVAGLLIVTRPPGRPDPGEPPQTGDSRSL